MTERTAAVLAAGAAGRSRHAGADKDRTAARPAFCRGAPALWRLASFLLALSFAAQARGERIAPGEPHERPIGDANPVQTPLLLPVDNELGRSL